MNRIWGWSAVFLLAMLAGTQSHADEVGKRLGKNNQPALLVAKEVHYDDKTSTAIASGDVEIVQGETILRADTVTYEVEKDLVTARGHVSILESSGTVFFADSASLKQKMQEGVVKNFKARLKDNSLFTARQGNKVSKSITHLSRLAYSPCKVCKPAQGESPKAPLWQIEARTATIDEEAKRVSYRDAFFDVYGLPVLYTPYFSHPTPDAPSQSGLLTPQYFHATDLGNVVKAPVYLSFAPNIDATLTPWYISNEQPLLAGEFRSLFKQGEFKINGAITDTYNRDGGGYIIPGTQTRGYIEAHGKYRLTDNWAAGVDAERTTDDTFLQRYRFGWRDVLTSRLYAERIEDRNYAEVETLSFQGLTTQDNSSLSPTILPHATMHYETAPQLWNSRVTADSSLLVAQQTEGASTRRISGTVGWKIPFVTRSGQVFEATTSLRGDGYDVSDQLSDTASRSTFSGTTGRVIPQFDINWRYPFVNRWSERSSLTITPVAELTVSPRMHLSSKIPNTDSQVAELSDVNLFSPSRFTGLDQVETGSRFTYGLRGQLQRKDDEWIEWLFGQTYQEDDDSPFPLTDSGQPHFSDYVGRVGINYRWFDIAYGFKLNRNSLAPISNNVNMLFTAKPVALDVTYVSLRNDPVFGNREEAFGNVSWDVTDNWRWTFSGRRDLGSDDSTTVVSATSQTTSSLLQPQPGTVGLGTSLVYHNECMMVTASVGRSYINQQDVRPSTTFGLMIVLNKISGGAAPPMPSVDGAGAVSTATDGSTADHFNGQTTDTLPIPEQEQRSDP